ncbi:hypothetical protein RP20_CCG020550 [Aedes albopictus]|nr:hypothetical protein RP20_CCG020550 [Aedes albopictus]
MLIPGCAADSEYINRSEIEKKTSTQNRAAADPRYGWASTCTEQLLELLVGNPGRHSQRHEVTEKKYKCNQCDFASRIPGHLKRHLLVHSGRKPFQCPHCEYSCNNIENLRKHVISTSKHKGKFLYECRYCPATTDSGEVFKANFSKDYRNHLLIDHKLTAEEANQAVRIF